MRCIGATSSTMVQASLNVESLEADSTAAPAARGAAADRGGDRGAALAPRRRRALLVHGAKRAPRALPAIAEASWLNGAGRRVRWRGCSIAERAYSVRDPEPKAGRRDGVRYVRVRDFPRGQSVIDELRRTSSRRSRISTERSSLRPGDVLVASTCEPLGRVRIVLPELDRANITQDTARIALIPDVNRDYVVASSSICAAAQRFFRAVASRRSGPAAST